MTVSRIFIAVFLLMIVLVGVVQGDESLPRLPDVISNVYSSVVYIEAGNDYGEWSGSGVVVHERGLILTAKHILVYADYVRVTFTNDDIYDGVNWFVDPNDDVGVLHIATLKDLPSASFEIADCELGEDIFIIGSPFGLFNSVNRGIISAIDRTEFFFGVEPMLQIDVATNPGNSGGPVFNMRGCIVGIVVGMECGGDGIGFITSADVCKKLVNEYVEKYPKNIHEQRSETARMQKGC